MSIENLIRLAPPPQSPMDQGSPDHWPVVEQTLNTTLPRDYKELINTYGSGKFGGYLSLFNPFSTLPYSNIYHLIHSIKPILEMYDQLKSQWPEYQAPFPAFPQPNGILPWGMDDNAGLVCWLTRGYPDEWRVVLLDSHYSVNYQIYPGIASDFLRDWLAGDFICNFYPEDVYPMEQPLFKSGIL